MIVSCPACNGPNSVLAYRMAQPPLCTDCQAALPYDEEALAPYPRVMLVEGPAKGEEYVFDGVVVLGRFPRNPIVLNDGQVSRKHASLGPMQGAGVVVKDLNSANGITVNGVQVKEAVIKHGDRLQIGDTEMVLRMPQAKVSNAPGAPPKHRKPHTMRPSAPPAINVKSPSCIQRFLAA
ncbi:FHA domain-containing protein [bacterium AH-315-F18]|nr:FHA domain-containing protein [bacterium AH-315-F18]